MAEDDSNYPALESYQKYKVCLKAALALR